jgi:hypothetical protein
MKRDDILRDLPNTLRAPWSTIGKRVRGERETEESRTKRSGITRCAVTDGAQMDGFVDLFADIIVAAGIPGSCVYRRKDVELPGFFRPTKEWDLLVVRDKSSSSQLNQVPSRFVRE